VEGHEAPVGRDRWVFGVAVALTAVGAGGAADQRGGVLAQVAHEHVAGRVAVVGVQVRGFGAKGHEAPVGRDRRPEGKLVALGPVGAGGAADQRDRVRLEVAHEHVLGPVAVVGMQVRVHRLEGHEAPVARDRGLFGPVRLRPCRACGTADQIKIVLGRLRRHGQPHQPEPRGRRHQTHPRQGTPPRSQPPTTPWPRTPLGEMLPRLAASKAVGNENHLLSLPWLARKPVDGRACRVADHNRLT
jgi:hypothetical protein